MTHHIGSLDSIIHDLTNRPGHLCKYMSPTIRYILRQWICVHLVLYKDFQYGVLARWSRLAVASR